MDSEQDIQEVKEEDTSSESIPEAPTLELVDEDLEESEFSEGENEECEVEEFTWEGKEYVLDPSTGTLYDKDIFEESGEAEEVGNYDSETKEVTLH